MWNSVELTEKNSNAQLARNFIISLPKELSIEENKKMIEEYVQNNFVKEGMVVDLAIHDDTCHIWGKSSFNMRSPWAKTWAICFVCGTPYGGF